MEFVISAMRQARISAGLTQAELAKRVGTSQSAINRYENGRQRPSPRTIQRLDAACKPQMRPSELLALKRDEILRCARAAGATFVSVFGSVARGTDDANSDLDLLADVPLGLSLIEFTELRLQLEDLVGIRIDLVTPSEIRSELKETILAEAKPI